MQALIIIFILGFYLFAFSISIATYVVNSLAIVTFCKKLYIPNGMLAFVPFASAYKLGQVADRCCAINGQKKNYAKTLLILQIVVSVLLIPYFAVIIIFNIIPYFSAVNEEIAILGFLAIIFVVFLLIAAAITTSVFVYIAHYKIFKIFDPKNAVIYTVLSIFTELSWLFLFIASRKDPVYPQVCQPNNAQIYENTTQSTNL